MNRPSRRTGRWWIADAPMLPGVDDDVRPVGQRRVQHGHRVAVADARGRRAAAAAARCAAPRRAPARGSAGRSRSAPASAATAIRADRRCARGCTARYGGADPIEYVGTDASASSSPARAVTVSRVPTSRHNALSRDCGGDARDGPSRRSPQRRRRSEPGVPATSLASGTVATRARSIARSCSSSARASSRATCSPAMIVIGPSARRSACAIGCGIAELCRGADRRRDAVGDRPIGLLNVLGQQQHCGPAAFARPRSPRAAPRRCPRAAPPAGSTPTPRRTAPRAFSAPLRPLVSWKAPRPSSVVGGWPISASTGTRLANASPSPGNGVQAAAARGRGHHAQPGAAAAVTVGHRGRGELVLGQHRGDVVAEVRGVVEILDVGTVDAEDVVDAARREIARRCGRPPDAFWPSVTCPPAPDSDTTRGRSWVHRVTGITGSFRSRTFPVSDETSCTAAISSFGIGVLPLGSAVAPDSPSQVAISVVTAVAAHHDHRQVLRRRRLPRLAPVAVGAGHVDAGAPAVTGQRDRSR